jgi:large subunit ribosomal protein L7/L12
MGIVKPSGADLLEAFSVMTVLELSKFVKMFEEKFGVTAAAPAAPAPAADYPATPVEEAEEQLEFNVVLEKIGGKKIQVIKTARALTKLGLADAKALIESAPVTILTGVDKEAAEAARAALTGDGAIVTVE